MVEDALAQETLLGDGPAVEPPATDEPEALTLGDDGEMVMPFDKISKLIVLIQGSPGVLESCAGALFGLPVKNRPNRQLELEKANSASRKVI